MMKKIKYILFFNIMLTTLNVNAYGISANGCEKNLLNYLVQPQFEFFNKELNIENKKEDYTLSKVYNLNNKLKYKLNKDINYLMTEASKVKEMSNVAKYISNTYDVPMETSEKIVYHVYSNSLKHNVEPHLVLGLIKVESTFDYKADVNSQKGLMQIIAKWHPKEIMLIKNKNLELKSIEGNIEAGVMILKKYIEIQKGNITNALQMYNGSLDDKYKKYSTKVLNTKKMFLNIIQKKEDV